MMILFDKSISVIEKQKCEALIYGCGIDNNLNNEKASLVGMTKEELRQLCQNFSERTFIHKDSLLIPRQVLKAEVDSD